MRLLDVALVCASALRLAVPIVFAAVAGLYAERSGVVDVALEGKLLVGAFAAGAFAAIGGNPWIGVAGGIAACCVMVYAQAFAAVTLRGNQLVIGLAINLIASGLTTFVGIAWFHRGGQTPQLSAEQRFAPLSLPFAADVAHVPVLGPIYATVLSGHTILGYAAAATVAITALVMYRSRYGLRLRACGDRPEAVDTAGISVHGIRYSALLVNGCLCGIGGAYLSIVQGGAFYRDMTAGRGFMALAAVIFGNWQPGRVLAACLLFSFADAIQGRFQGAVLGGLEIPTQLIQAIPYLLTLLLLAGVVGRLEAPKAAGTPYP